MRIPSELHRESLYGQKPARRSKQHGQSWRRVIRLLIVMALILVVMRQVARSGAYEIFFANVQQKQVSPPSGYQSGKQTVASQSAFMMTQPMRSQFDAWLIRQSIDQLSDVLAGWLAGNSLEINVENIAVPETASGQSLVALAIQQRLITAMQDGTVWRAADGQGLTSTLAMHSERCKRFNILNQTRPRAVTAGVLPLLQQPDIYRGRTVIASGEVVRIENLHASDNPFGVSAYWKLWLMPLDSSNRPWLVIVPDLPPELASLTSTLTSPPNPAPTDSEDGLVTQSWTVKTPRPKIEVDGEFLKRLSYRSAAGVELTPVVAGHVTTIHANGNALVSTAISQANPSEAKRSEPAAEISLGWILAGSAGVGLLLAIGVMRRTAKINQQMRRRRNRHVVKLSLAWMMLSASLWTTALSAQSMMDLLPGYDAKSLPELTRPSSPASENPGVNVNEVAKLIYRIDRLSESALRIRVDRSASPPVVGDAVTIEGKISDTAQLPIDEELQEYLELKKIESIRLADVDGVPHLLFSKMLPRQAVKGDRISGMAVRIRIPSESTDESEPIEDAASLRSGQTHPNWIVDVAGRLNWTPAHPPSPAAAVLASAGVHLSRIADLDKLDRQPLSDSDSSLFYPMIGAADVGNIRTEENAASPEEIQSMREFTLDVSPVNLLQKPSDYTGEWIRLNVETVRITRVAVESPERQRQVGSDHYFEIDAIGDLGRVQLKIEVPGGDPVTMENRYPVTIVTAHLPSFLQPDDTDQEQLVITRSVPIRVEGFFYRLWSYESDLMQSHGGKQFAPLIIAGVIEDQRSSADDLMGVQTIGNIAAIGVIAAIVGVIIFGVVTRRGDRRARERRQ